MIAHSIAHNGIKWRVLFQTNIHTRVRIRVRYKRIDKDFLFIEQNSLSFRRPLLFLSGFTSLNFYFHNAVVCTPFRNAFPSRGYLFKRDRGNNNNKRRNKPAAAVAKLTPTVSPFHVGNRYGTRPYTVRANFLRPTDGQSVPFSCAARGKQMSAVTFETV